MISERPLKKSVKFMKDKVSVIIPVYNVPDQMLDRCIESIIGQSYQNTEIVIVNDGTCQSNLKIISKYKNNKKIIILNKENGGLSSARNFGFEHSSGDWVCFVDGDDWLEKDTLSSVIDSVYQEDEIVCFGTVKEYRKREFKYNFNGIFNNKDIFHDRLELISHLFDFKTQIGDVTAKLYRKDFLVKNNIFHDIEVRQGIESIIFNYLCFCKTKQLHYVDYFGYRYAYNDKSITLYQDDKCIEDILTGIKKIQVLIGQDDLHEKIAPLFLRRIQYIIVTTIISGYLSPNNHESYSKKKRKMEQFLLVPEIHEALIYKLDDLDVLRKSILYLARCRQFILLSLIAAIRNLQKEKF